MTEQEKIKLRKYAFSLREKIVDKARLSANICGNIKNLKEYIEAKIVLAFYPFGEEPDIRELFQHKTKTYFLPRVENDTIAFYEFNEKTELRKNKWGILEPAPVNKLIELSKAELIIVPALAVDRKGFRLGYGGGYYDKFLPGLEKECLKICPVFSELLFENIPHEKFDIRVDKIITE